MSEMPARIWVRVCGGGVSMPSGKLYTTFVGEDREYDGRHVFVRSDIAERMAEALDNLLAASERHIFSTECQKEREAARSALSAWKDGR